MRHRKLAVVLGILVLAACSAEGPANNKRDATAAALSLQKSPRKYKAPKFDSNVRVLAQIPIQGVKKDDDCDWSAEFAKAVSGYEAKHPEKEEGRGASLTEWDKDSCAAVVSIVVAKTHENVTPKTVDTLSIQVVGGPVVSPEFELVRRKLRDEDLVLNSDEGPNFGFPGTFSPPQFTAEETCWYYMGLLNYTRNLTSTQDLRTTGLGSKRAQTQVTVYGRTYSYVNPTSLSCVKIDSIKVIKTAYAYHDFQPDGGTPDGIIYWYDPASTGWSACHNGTQSGCVAEAFGGVATRFYKNCDLDANGIPGWQFRFAIGSPGHPYYGRIQAWGAQQGVAQIASFSTDSGASRTATG